MNYEKINGMIGEEIEGLPYREPEALDGSDFVSSVRPKRTYNPWESLEQKLPQRKSGDNIEGVTAEELDNVAIYRNEVAQDIDPVEANEAAENYLHELEYSN